MEKFWSIDPKSVKSIYDDEGRLIELEGQMEIDSKSWYESVEYITVPQFIADDENLRKAFPFEMKQDYHQMLCSEKTLYKTPQNGADWNKHYLMKAESASEIAEEYFEKARMYKKKAKDVLKGRY